MYLGIDDQEGVIYEGSGGPRRPVVPHPTVTQAKLIKKPDDWRALPASHRQQPISWIFREDTFDAVTRTRRGRLYQARSGAGYPDHNARVMPYPFEDAGGRMSGADGKIARPLHIYVACFELLNMPNKGQGAVLALGNVAAASAWRIVQTEVTVGGDVMLVLKALTAFGLISEIDKNKVPSEFHADVDRALERAVNSAFRETPESVVDQCRNAMTVVLSRWLVQRGEDRKALSWDLGQVAKSVELGNLQCAAWVAGVVAKLHSRGKMNETRSLRPPVEEDAELAVHILGFTLREIGWAS